VEAERALADEPDLAVETFEAVGEPEADRGEDAARCALSVRQGGRKAWILRRKARTSRDFDSLDALAERIMAFQHHWQQIAEPLDWNFTRRDLDR
jgi:hypothetical protein